MSNMERIRLHSNLEHHMRIASIRAANGVLSQYDAGECWGNHPFELLGGKPARPWLPARREMQGIMDDVVKELRGWPNSIYIPLWYKPKNHR